MLVFPLLDGYDDNYDSFCYVNFSRTKEIMSTSSVVFKDVRDFESS